VSRELGSSYCLKVNLPIANSCRKSDLKIEKIGSIGEKYSKASNQIILEAMVFSGQRRSILGVPVEGF